MWFIFGLLVLLIAIIGIIYCLIKVAQQDLKVWESTSNNNVTQITNQKIPLTFHPNINLYLEISMPNLSWKIRHFLL